MDQGVWRKCSTCKKPIALGAKYWACNVTTCNRPRVGVVFCSVSCWDSHVPIFRHRDSWSLEKKAPVSSAEEPVAKPSQPEARGKSMESEDEILIVVSKLKAYIRERSGGMSTSNDVSEILSSHLRRACDAAIHVAREDGRKTVMARDFK